MPIGAIINAAASVGNTLLQGRQQRQNLADQQRHNREMAEYQYQKDLDQWNRANEYNTPAAQMQRFQDAGLNPNLMYSQGNPGNTATSLPKYQQARADFTKRQPMFNPKDTALSALAGYQSVKMRDSQADLLRAQVDTQEATADKERAQAHYWENAWSDKVDQEGSRSTNLWYDATAKGRQHLSDSMLFNVPLSKYGPSGYLTPDKEAIAAHRASQAWNARIKQLKLYNRYHHEAKTAKYNAMMREWEYKNRWILKSMGLVGDIAKVGIGKLVPAGGASGAAGTFKVPTKQQMISNARYQKAYDARTSGYSGTYSNFY